MSPYDLGGTVAAPALSPEPPGGPLGALSLASDALRSLAPDASPQAVLAAAFAAFPGRIALVSSFGTESAPLLHMAAAIDPHVPVIFLETGQLFPQTIDYRHDLARKLGLTDVRDRRPSFTDLSLRDPGADLWRSDPDDCCALRKVEPLEKALEGFDAWITGRKRFQGAERARLPVLEFDRGRTKINPLANASKADLEAYARANALPSHPLMAGGYASVGCRPCTQASDDGRAGRWSGSAKTECGIHRPRAAPVDIGGGV